MLLATAHPLASLTGHLGDLARPVANRLFRVPLDVEKKPDESPVTRADREIEAMLRKAIQKAFPADGLYGEEHGRDRPQADRLWVIDPIDGTKSFISGMPTFGTLVAVLEHGEAVLGMIDMPAMGERWLGAKGHVSTYNGKPCSTRAGRRLADAILYATSPDMFKGSDRDRFERASQFASLRRFGGDCYAYALLASGYIDAVVETNLQPYDYLAMVPVIEGAGGFISDWEGGKLGLESKGQVVAAGSRELHAELLLALRP